MNPTELINPRCKITGTKPVIRSTRHVFLDLPRLSDQLQEYIDGASKDGGWSANCLQVRWKGRAPSRVRKPRGRVGGLEGSAGPRALSRRKEPHSRTRVTHLLPLLQRSHPRPPTPPPPPSGPQVTNAWMRDGLKTRCITRDLKWGIPVPLDGFK